MKERIDLTEGRIADKLVKLALPIMATSFIQMAYNLTDMLWVGRIGSSAVAAVGTAGFFSQLAVALAMVSKVGAEIKVAQSLGRKDEKSAKKYITAAFQMIICISILMGSIILAFKSNFIGFFELESKEVVLMAESYLSVIAMGMIITNLIPVFTAIFNGAGNSKIPFIINTVGLLANMILDPLLIFGFGPVPKLGVIGAAIATITAQAIVVGCFVLTMIRSNEKYLKINLLSKMDFESVKSLCKLGLPAGIQTALFTVFSILIAKIIAGWGEVPIAAQKVGCQIEAITWMTAGGFSTALSSFVGQNYGAGKFDRIKKGYKATIIIAGVVGIFATLLLVIGGEWIFSLFINEPKAILVGKDYLRIMGYTQLFMCLEITTVGVFNGLGRTTIPATISVILTGVRIPIALVLSKPELLGLNGVWWSISISMVLKGVTIVSILWYLVRKKNLLHSKKEVSEVI